MINRVKRQQSKDGLEALVPDSEEVIRKLGEGSFSGVHGAEPRLEGVKRRVGEQEIKIT